MRGKKDRKRKQNRHREKKEEGERQGAQQMELREGLSADEGQGRAHD